MDHSMVIFHGKLLVITRWYSNEHNVNLESTPVPSVPSVPSVPRDQGEVELIVPAEPERNPLKATLGTNAYTPFLPLTYHDLPQFSSETKLDIDFRHGQKIIKRWIWAIWAEQSYSNRALDKVSSHSCARGCPLASATRLFSYSTAIDSYRSCRSYRNVFPKYPLAMTNIAIENDHL